MHNILSDFGYAVNEYGAWIVPSRGADGSVIGKNYGVYWRCVRDLEYKYAEGVYDTKITCNVSQKPKPGTDPKAGMTAPFGDFNVRLHGFIRTDSKFIWQNSPLLKWLLPIREKYFYMGRIQKFRSMMRYDYEHMMESLKKYYSYMPAVG